MKKLIYLFIFAFAFYAGEAVAQVKVVSGTVKDDSGPLAQASVFEKGMPSNGVVTNQNGSFTLTLRGNSQTLVIEHVGFLSQEVPARQGAISISLLVDTKGLEDVIVVGFGKKKKITNTGAVSQISGAIVRQVPTANIQNTLSGRLPGFFSQQRGGQPGQDAADFFIRGVSSFNSAGSQPLIIVDDVEYTYAQVSQLDANEIETVSILKDASTTAVYGIKGANGVLVITTRRGKSGKPAINITGEYGIQRIIEMPKYLNSYQTAVLRNEALANDNYGKDPSTWVQPQFTDRDLELFNNGKDPYGHPYVDWIGTLINRTAPQARYNVDISGGSEQVKYFVSLGYYTQDGVVKNFAPANPVAKDYNNNYYYRRMNFRSNLDINPNKRLAIRLDFNGRLGESNQPAGVDYINNNVGLFYRIENYILSPPFAIPLMNPNGTYPYNNGPGISNNTYRPSTLASLAESGYRRSYTNDLNTTLKATHQLDFMTRGLSVSGLVSFTNATVEGRNLTAGQYPSFVYNPMADTTNGKPYSNPANIYALPTFTRGGGLTSAVNTLNIQATINYDRTFSGHHFTGLLLYNQRSNSITTSDVTTNMIPANSKGVSGRLGYDYKQRYLLDFSVARNGTDRFTKDNRYGIFPAGSVGWNVAEEKFFNHIFPFVSTFKLRGSYGLVGSDVVPGNNYVYVSSYVAGPTYNFGLNPTNNTSLVESSLANSNVTWEKERKLDLGVDITMFKGKLTLTADYFNNFRYDQLIGLATVPQEFGQAGANTVTIPSYNIGEVRNKGFDGIISYNNKIGKLGYNISANISIAKNTIVRTSEAPLFPWLARTGHPLNTSFGYQVIGFYESADDIAKSPKNTFSPIIVPGDLKYKDINGDNIINGLDASAIGLPNLPSSNGGVNLGLNYMGISLDVLFQSAWNFSVKQAAENIDPFHGNLRPIHLTRWTPNTAATAQYPRLSTNNGNLNSSWGGSASGGTNDFFLIDGSYVRLKQLSLSYQLPDKLLKHVGVIKNTRIYATGYNLITWKSYDKYQQDPETQLNNNTTTSGNTYPNVATFNFGIQLGL